MSRKPTTREELLQRLHDDKVSHFAKHLGFVVESVADGRCVVGVQMDEHHKNLGGVAHGGLASSLLDTAMGAAVVSTLADKEWCATLQLNVTYLTAITDGTVRAEGSVVRRARRVAFAEGRVVDDEGRLYAVAQGTWHVWPEGE